MMTSDKAFRHGRSMELATPHLFADIVRQIRLLLAEMDFREGKYTSLAKLPKRSSPKYYFYGFQITSFVGTYSEALNCCYRILF
jgi:hypothetical protein